MPGRDLDEAVANQRREIARKGGAGHHLARREFAVRKRTLNRREGREEGVL
jgi:hypothetical protein